MNIKINRESLKTPAVIFIFILVVLVFFSNIVFMGKSLVCGDLILEHVPNKQFISSSLLNGHFPLWMPGILFGFPLFASAQEGVLYPVNLALMHFPANRQIDYSVLIHYLISGIFMFIYLMRIIKNRKIAFLGMVTWVFSGMFVYWSNVSWIMAMSYTPLFFYLAESYAATKKIRYAFALPLVVSITIFTGQVQSTLYIFIITMLYYILRIEWNKNTVLLNIKSTVFFALCALFGVAIAGVQVLPSLELTQFSTRKGSTWMQYVLGTEKVSLTNIINTVFPYMFGSTQNNTYAGFGVTKSWSMSYISVYTGISCFIFLLFSFGRVLNDKKIRLFLILVAASFLFSMGGNFFINRLFVFVPGLSVFRNPIRMMEPCIFLVISAAMYTLSVLKEEAVPAKAMKIILCLALIALISAAAVLVEEKNLLQSMSGVIGNIVKTKFMSGQFHHYSYDYYYSKFLNAANFVIAHMAFQLGVLVAVLLVFLFYGTKKIGRGAFIVLLIAMTVADLFFNFKGFGWAADSKIFKNEPETAAFIKQYDKGYYRILPWRYVENEVFVFKNGRALGTDNEYKDSLEMLTPNLSMYYKINNYGGYDPLEYKKHVDFLADTDSGGMKGGDSSNECLSKGFNTLNLTCTKYILSPFSLDFRQLRLINTIKTIKIYKNTAALPIISFASSARYLKDDTDILGEIRGNRVNFSREVLIKGEGKNEKSPGKPVLINVKRWDSEINFTAETPVQGYAVISNSFYPGWKAYVDGAQTHIYNADYIFQAVKLEKGTHEIRLIYEPDSVKKGTVITVISLILYFALLITGIISRKKINF